jgi:hypothetical protein
VVVVLSAALVVANNSTVETAVRSGGCNSNNGSNFI